MENLVDLDDFDDDEFDKSSWGGQSNQDNVSETLSARNHEDEDERISTKKNDYVPQEEYNPHESEEMDPMMFGHVDQNESFEDFDNEHFEEAYHEETAQEEQSSKPLVRTLDDFDDSDEGFDDDNFSDLSEDEDEEEEDTQTNSFRIVKKTDTLPEPKNIEIPKVNTISEEKKVYDSVESNESEAQSDNVAFEKQYRTLDDYDDFSDEEPAQPEEETYISEQEEEEPASMDHNEPPKNTYYNQPQSQSIRSDSYRTYDQKSTQEQNFAKTLPPKINYKQQEPKQDVQSTTASISQSSSQPILQQTQQSTRSQSSFQIDHTQDQQSLNSSQKQTLQPTFTSQQLTLQAKQSQAILQRQSSLKVTLPSYTPKADLEDDLENYNPIQSIKVSPKMNPVKTVTIEQVVIEDNRSDKSSSSTKSNPVMAQPTATKENLERVFLSLKSKQDFKVKESEILSPKRPEKKKEERILKEDSIFYPVKENQSRYISLDDIAQRNNTLRMFNMETIMSEALSKKTSKHHVDLRDEKILQLVLDLYFSNGLIQKTETSKVRRNFLEERPRVMERNNEYSSTPPPVFHSKASKKLSSKSSTEPKLLSLHFNEEGSLSQVLESYLLDFLEKNKRNLKSNLIFIVFNELVSILNTISLYFYTELTDCNNLSIPCFSYKGPVMSSHLFDSLMSCFPFTRISNSKYTLESWISINHISEVIYTLQRIIKSRFWNLDHRTNCDTTHLKLDLGLNVFDLYLPKQSNSNQKLSKQILETPLNEFKYFQSKQAREREEEENEGNGRKSKGSFLDDFKNKILYEKSGNSGRERNLFSKYHQPLVDSCVNEVLSEVFGDTLIIQSIRERIVEKINKL